MSFSSDVKQLLSETETKKACCRESVKRGQALLPFEESCEKDGGCYLRGVFLKCGSISSPGRNFMLSFTPPSDELCDYLADFLDNAGLSAKRTVRKGRPVLYYKASESIEDALAFMGGSKVALIIMGEKVLSEVRNNANRLCNAETANLDRTARAAAEQNEAIRIIQKHGAMGNLSPELRECAELRLAHPDLSLAQLREEFREPVSKSGLNHRFKKLIEIAEMLENS